ncbi:hypothetical protein BKA66DRAFT_477677 [Pyrenochaeta sp. MPI-SDFR-AT-0127]|nr:hypothetical protein BKA66DRAFT_477677 [Pyrenochaeta sp. MPI-SDFR-AT-0127]
MAQVVLELVSFATSVGLGIAQILIPSDSGAAIDQLALGNSRVRLGFGFNPNRKVINDTMGGRVPSIRVYNDHAKRIGMASSPIDSIAVAGQWIDITVVQDVKFQQPTFLEVDAMDKDLVCLAYIGQTWSDGTKLGWLGDIGRFCGTAWHHSALYVSKADGGLQLGRGENHE